MTFTGYIVGLFRTDLDEQRLDLRLYVIDTVDHAYYTVARIDDAISRATARENSNVSSSVDRLDRAAMRIHP